MRATADDNISLLDRRREYVGIPRMSQRNTSYQRDVLHVLKRSSRLVGRPSDMFRNWFHPIVAHKWRMERLFQSRTSKSKNATKAVDSCMVIDDRYVKQVWKCASEDTRHRSNMSGDSLLQTRRSYLSTPVVS